jgi:hypothetical protein
MSKAGRETDAVDSQYEWDGRVPPWERKTKASRLEGIVFTRDGLSKMLAAYGVMLFIIGALLGLLIGYAFAAAIYTENFALELRWHYAPHKVNATDIMENQFDRGDESYLLGGQANYSALSGEDREIVGGWNGSAWLRGVS